MPRHLGLLVCLFAACRGASPAPEPEAEPAPATDREAELARNHATWTREGARLSAEAPGQWVLILDGAVHGPWSDFGAATAAADELASNARHAYLYRAGVDDVDVTFVLSPFMDTHPRWTQLGRRFQIPQKFTIAAAGNVWYRAGKQMAWGDAGARLRVETIGGVEAIGVRSVASGLFQQDLTLTASDAAELGPARFTAPGRAWYATKEWPCEKRLVRVRIPELDVDWPAVAFVLPPELTERLSGTFEPDVEWPGLELVLPPGEGD